MHTHSDLLEQCILLELAFKKCDYKIPLQMSDGEKAAIESDMANDRITAINPLDFSGVISINTTFVRHIWSDRIHRASDLFDAYIDLQAQFDATTVPDDFKGDQ